MTEDTITITGGSDSDILSGSGDTIVLDLNDYGAAQPTYTISGLDTITLDNSISTSYTMSQGATVGGIYTTGTNYSWANPLSSSTVNIDADGVNIKEGGDLKIGGVSITESISKIEERLGILRPNPELEDRWEKLKELRQQYIEMEKDLLEKEKIMKILKEK